MSDCLNVEAWRASSPAEMRAFLAASQPSHLSTRQTLSVRTYLRPVDVYAYLKARFGEPNGILERLRQDDSDNLFHWDFIIRSGTQDVHISGASRETHITVPEPLRDDEWQRLILGMRADFGRVAAAKAAVTRGFEKFAVFQNKFVSLADLCAELHARIVDTPPYERLPRAAENGFKSETYDAAFKRASQRADALFSDCLQLRLVMPVMAEAFINMIILTFCKPEIRGDRARYDAFVRAGIRERIALLPDQCAGFARGVDETTPAFANFMRVFNQRNFALHGNVDPVREQLEIVYFEGKRPLFVEPGHHLERFFEHVESQSQPQAAIKDYEDVHAFLIELSDCLSSSHRAFFDQVISDAYPGYELKKHGVTRLFPDHRVMGMMQGIRYDDELDVTW